MEEKGDKAHLLAASDEEEQSVDSEEETEVPQRGKRRSYLMLTMLTVSLMANVFLFFWHVHPRSCPPDLGKSPYTGNTFDTFIQYHSTSEYWDPSANQSDMDDAWEALDTNPVAVALHDEHAKQLGLTPSTPFPWDTERSVYYLKGLHDLHCLKLIRKSIVSQFRGEETELSDEHVFHCLDALRQDVMCTADDTPMPAAVKHKIGDGQIRRCRNWDQMISWAQQPDRNACHQFDDYREAAHSLEFFAFCPENSPYRLTAEAYFEYHGHKEPYKVKVDGSDPVG
ncbi:hypothetical protein BCR34DRAFT_629554 [Clohesyomyces aquaticus]|uniref:Tat pathway signal sequence n=1 Tax=Clohesyomyces aquaticus TaxID=1231657 RepID=A0A1Y1Y2B5_9PLEO|nr:hypothetical protein BCR34DRAFT_629554 [Clohesyomyces aquaticus]